MARRTRSTPPLLPRVPHLHPLHDGQLADGGRLAQQLHVAQLAVVEVLLLLVAVSLEPQVLRGRAKIGT